jgi:hypothetical protein
MTKKLNCTKQSLPWDLYICSGGQGSRCLPRMPDCSLHAHKILSLVPLLRQLKPTHTCLRNFLLISLTIIVPSKPNSPTWSLPIRCSDYNSVQRSPIVLPVRLTLHADSMRLFNATPGRVYSFLSIVNIDKCQRSVHAQTSKQAVHVLCDFPSPWTVTCMSIVLLHFCLCVHYAAYS